MEDSIMRQALGRMAAIGELYDARRDRFCHMNIFKSAISPKAVQTVDNQFTDSRYSLSSTLSEKLKSLELSGQLKVSIFGGICGLEGSSKFLKDEKKSERAVRAHLIYNVKTITDQINIFNDDLREIINTGVAKYEEATHVVVEINWGANSFLSIEHQNTNNKSHREIQGQFEVMIEKLGFGISGHAKGVHDKSDFASFAECNFHIFADLLPKNEGLSQTLEGYFKLMNQMPELIKNSNNGKGKPLSYGMISLALVRKHIEIEALTDQIIQNIDEHTIMEFENLFNEISDLKQKVNDVYDDIEKHQYCIEESALNRISEIKTNVELSETKLRCQLAEKIVLFRSSDAGADILQKLIFDYQQDSFSTLNIPKQLNEFNLYREKINFVKSLESKGVRYVGKNTALDALLLQYFDKNLYILNYNRHQAIKNEEQWAKCRAMFFTFVNNIDDENGPVCIFAEKNLDNEHTSIDETISISHYKNGICISQRLETRNSTAKEEKYLRRLETRIQENKSQMDKTKAEHQSEIRSLETSIQEYNSQLDKTKTEHQTEIRNLKSEMQEIKSQMDKTKAELQSEIQSLQLEHNNRVEEWRALESHQERHLEILENQVTVLQYLHKDDGCDYLPEIFIWKIQGITEIMKDLVEKKPFTFRREEYYTDQNGEQFRPFIFTDKENEHVFIDLEFMASNSLQSYFHSRRFILIDQSTLMRKNNVELIGRPMCKINSAKDMMAKSFSATLFFPPHVLLGKNNYVKNDTILIKIILKPVAFLWKKIQVQDGVFVWRINDYSKKKRDQIDGVKLGLTSKPFKTSHVGYTAHLKLFLNGHKDGEGKHISVYLYFLLGEHDDSLPLPFKCKCTFCLIDQTDSPKKENISMEYTYEFATSQLNWGFPQFVLQSTVERSKYLKNDSIVIQATVKIL